MTLSQSVDSSTYISLLALCEAISPCDHVCMCPVLFTGMTLHYLVLYSELNVKEESNDESEVVTTKAETPGRNTDTSTHSVSTDCITWNLLEP